MTVVAPETRLDAARGHPEGASSRVSPIGVGLALVVAVALGTGPVATAAELGAPQAGEPLREGSRADDEGQLDAVSDVEATVEPGPGGKRMSATAAPTAPVIDGIVDEDVWDLAEVVRDFLQREPNEGQPATERTEVRILYDEENIYLGFILRDRDPSGIAATELRRDSRMQSDDTIAVQFDTYHDHRNAFLFRVNPNGAKYDATIKNESEINSNWDERWEAAARITERGWEAEMAIPFSTLRYPTGTHLWGVDFKREIRRKNEEDNWSNYSQDYRFNAVSQGGHLVGLRDLKLTDRFRVKPYVTGGWSEFNRTDAPHDDRSGEFGIDNFKVQITPNLTGDLTVNTDFAQVEVDDQRVNLTRFSQFFPEKREFFLEGATNFSFGTVRGPGGGFRGPPYALLFHSRRIGLRSGEPLPITYGAKLTGKIGSGNLGLLNVQTDDGYDSDDELLPGQNFTALRWQQDVLSRSSVGMLFTNVQGPDGAYNRVLGADASFRLADHFTVGGFVSALADDEVEGNPIAGQLEMGWDSDAWSASADLIYVEDDFHTDLGFILRQDVVRQSYEARWKPRPNWGLVRQLFVSGELEYITDTAGTLLSRNQEAGTWIRFESGDSISIGYNSQFERLEDEFEISDGVVIPIGDYEFENIDFSINAYGGRRISGRVRGQVGEFFDGTRFSLGGGLSIRVNEKIAFGPGYTYNEVDLPGGSFITHQGNLRAAVSFSDRWLTDSLVQYNSVSENLEVFARLRFIYRPGDNIYMVFKQARAYGGDYEGAADRSLALKATHAFNW